MELSQSQSGIYTKIREKKSTICVVGLGQVGLPTALSFLKAGFRVVGYDTNEKLILNLLECKTRSDEKGFTELVTKFVIDGSFVLTTAPNTLSDVDIIIICVPTPLDASGFRVDLSFLKNAIVEVANSLINQKLIIIESSLPPKTMVEFVIPTIEHLSGKIAGKDFLISFCPERILPGNALEEISNNARVIGSNDNASYLATHQLFQDLTKGEILRADTTTAEVSKLAENSYRDINIAFANELAIICEELKVDVLSVISLANTHQRVNIHRPGPGVGGPCLPKDPYLLPMPKKMNSSLIRTARRINDSMPGHVIDLLIQNLHLSDKNRAELDVVVLGASYKADVKDTRYSPTERIISLLRTEGFLDLSVHDPYSGESFGAKYSANLRSSLRTADCVLIATGHALYSSLSESDFKKGCVIVDAARILDKMHFKKNEITYASLGS